MTPELAWVIFVVDVVPVLAALPFLAPPGKGFSLTFWRSAARDVHRAGRMVVAVVRRDVRAEGVPWASRVRRVVFAVPEVARASCYSMAAVLAEVDPGSVEMRLWRPVFSDVHPVVEFVGATFAVFMGAVFVMWPPAIDWSANPVLIGVWVLQAGAFAAAVAWDFARLAHDVVASESAWLSSSY